VFNRRIGLVVCAIAMSLSGCMGLKMGSGPDWPMVRGNPAATAESPDREIASPMEVVWVFPSGGELSTPVVMDGLVYVGGTDGVLTAISVGNGRVVWQDRQVMPVTVAPAISDRALYLVTYTGELLAIDKKTGKRLWREQVAAAHHPAGVVAADGTIYAATIEGTLAARQEVEDVAGKWQWKIQVVGGISGAPAVGDGRVVVSTRTKGAVVCFDAGTGEELWRTAVNKSLSPPAVYTIHKRVVVAAEEQVVALELEDGEQAWTFDARALIVGEPALASGLAIIATVPEAGESSLHTIDVYNGKEVMKRRIPGHALSSPIIANHAAYLATSGANQEYVAVGLWLGDIVDAGYNDKAFGKTVCVGANRLFVTTDSGELRCYGPAAKAPEETPYERYRRQIQEGPPTSRGSLR